MANKVEELKGAIRADVEARLDGWRSRVMPFRELDDLMDQLVAAAVAAKPARAKVAKPAR